MYTLSLLYFRPLYPFYACTLPLFSRLEKVYLEFGHLTSDFGSRPWRLLSSIGRRTPKSKKRIFYSIKGEGLPDVSLITPVHILVDHVPSASCRSESCCDEGSPDYKEYLNLNHKLERA